MSEPKRPPLTVAKLAVRDGRRCIHCGTTEALTTQHRGVKGTGGRRSAERPSNGVILCWSFNVDIEANAELAAWAIQCGWKISTHADPAKMRVWDANELAWFMLADDFTRSRIG